MSPSLSGPRLFTRQTGVVGSRSVPRGFLVVPAPPQAHSVVGTQMSNTRQQRPRAGPQTSGNRGAGAHSGKGRETAA